MVFYLKTIGVCVGLGGCNEANGGCNGLCIAGETAETSSHQCLCEDRHTPHFDADMCRRQQPPGNRGCLY